MELLVVRHAVAEGREEFARTGHDDARRPLTPEGRRKFEKGARGILALVPEIDLLASSSLDRATQSAEILEGASGGKVRAVRLRELEPEADPAALFRWLGRHRHHRLVAVVGHEPHLSRFVEQALAGRPSGFVALRKGGACLLELGARPEAGGARLRWLLTAAQLRRLARGPSRAERPPRDRGR